VPVNTYEAMFLLDSAKLSPSWEESEQQVHEILKKHDSEIVASRQWDERRLAYPIGNHKKGTYLLTYFKAESSKVNDIVADCKLHELVIRELILKVHPKLVDHLVNQAMSYAPSEEEEEGPPRRRRERE